MDEDGTIISFASLDSGIDDALDNFNNSGAALVNTDINTEAQTALTGDMNSLPTVSTNTNASGAYGQVLGSVTPQNATNLGTALGSLVRNVQGIPGAFSKGYNASASGNSLSTWWQYASTTDKLIVGLGVLTLAWMVYEHK